MTIRCLLFVALLCPFFTTAQTNYREGYVITDAGDTLKGFINYREWYNNPDKFEFRSVNSNTVTDITAATAKKVTITGLDSYQRFEASISMNEITFEKLTETANTSGVTKTVFLKELQTGNYLNLYSYTDKIKMRFYILKSGNYIPDELVYVKTLKETQEQTQDIYRQQLTQLAFEYKMFTANLKNRIQTASYSETGLKDIVSRINTNSATAVQTQRSKSSGISYFAGIGVMQSAIHYSGADPITSTENFDANGNRIYNKVTTTNFTPRIAAGINFYSKLWVHRLSVKAELAAFHFTSTTVSYERYNNYSSAVNQYTFHLNGWSFVLTPQLMYKFYSSNSMKAYVGAGPGLNFLITSKNSIYKLGMNQPLTFNQTTNDYLLLAGFSINLTGRVGIQLKQKFDIYIYGSTPVQYNVYNPEDFSVKSGVLAFCAAYNF